MYQRRARAFTLLELLIVVGILALLAAVVVPQFFRAGEGAKVELTRSQIGRTGNIGTPLGLYRAAVGRFPDTSEGLRALVEPPAEEDLEKKWRTAGPFIEDANALVDPWGNDFEYAFPGEKNSEEMYDLWSFGPDGEDGTEDDIGNWRSDDDRPSRYSQN